MLANDHLSTVVMSTDWYIVSFDRFDRYKYRYYHRLLPQYPCHTYSNVLCCITQLKPEYTVCDVTDALLYTTQAVCWQSVCDATNAKVYILLQTSSGVTNTSTSIQTNTQTQTQKVTQTNIQMLHCIAYRAATQRIQCVMSQIQIWIQFVLYKYRLVTFSNTVMLHSEVIWWYNTMCVGLGYKIPLGCISTNYISSVVTTAVSRSDNWWDAIRVTGVLQSG